MLLNAAKCQGYSFYHFWVVKGKPTRGLKLPPLPTPTPRLGLIYYVQNIVIPENKLMISTQQEWKNWPSDKPF